MNERFKITTIKLPMSQILIGSIPMLIFLGLAGMAIYCLLTDGQRREKLGEYHNHPDKDMPLYNKGHCDRYSVGTFHL